jgi:D-amino-acid oxidase
MVKRGVAVAGAGVIGMTTAVCLAEAGLPVLVRASEPAHRTTSVVAGALPGGPSFADPETIAAGGPAVQAQVGWHRESLAEFDLLAEQPDTGVRVARGRMVSRQGDGIPRWGRQRPGFEPCSPPERAGYPVAFWMRIPVVDMPRYFDYLTARFKAAGGVIETGPVDSLAELAGEHGVAVNCTGVWARHLAGDPAVFPVRGQHVLVENPGLDEFLFEFGGGHRGTRFVGYFPHPDRVVLGGTADKDDWNLEPDPAQTEEILRRCAEVEHRLAGARVLGVLVGLRAARPRPRLEAERMGKAMVIHNYGHGSVGVGMSWGCAREAMRLTLDAAGWR